ncbi:MAG TPA: hypothetical protein VL122_08315 [Nitrospirota bacterium]|nr:hypothetical protein [Nitrospirota bacterium]
MLLSSIDPVTMNLVAGLVLITWRWKPSSVKRTAQALDVSS